MSTNMKIVILIARFPPSYLGGAEIAVYNLAKQLSKLKHEVHVITMSDPNSPDENTQDDFYLHRIKTIEIPLLRNIVFSIRSLYLMKTIKPHVVHSQTISIHNAGLPAFLAKKILKIPYIVWGRGSDIYLYRHEKQFKRIILKNSNAAIALTDDMKEAMQNIWNMPICVIPNGIDLEKFNTLRKSKTHSTKIAESDDKVILFVGRLHPIKGLSYLIEAMKIIHQRYPKSRLLIVGDGDERDYLNMIVKNSNLNECVTFIGKVPNKSIPEYMALADILVLPSLSEGFPVVILEAMACGLPIVATKIRGNQEIIKDWDNGFLVEPRNSKNITEKVLLLLKDDKLRQIIAGKNIEVAKRYSWESVARRVEEIYFGVVSNHDV